MKTQEFMQVVEAHPCEFGGLNLKYDNVTTWVAEGPAGVLTKIFLNTADPARKQIHAAKKEVSLLRFLSNNAPQGIHVPAPLSDVIYFKKSRVLACYRMSRVPGRRKQWDHFNDYFYPGVKVPALSKGDKSYFHSAGIALAKLHTAFNRASPEQNLLCGEPEKRLVGIRRIRPYGRAWVQAFARADEHLKAYAKPGIVHGDFSDSNIKVGKDAGVVSVFDFGSAHYNANQYEDIISTPNAGRQFLCEGYETVRPLDWDLFNLAQIAELTRYREMYWSFPRYKEALSARMASVAHITGFTP